MSISTFQSFTYSQLIIIFVALRTLSFLLLLILQLPDVAVDKPLLQILLLHVLGTSDLTHTLLLTTQAVKASIHTPLRTRIEETAQIALLQVSVLGNPHLPLLSVNLQRRIARVIQVLERRVQVYVFSARDLEGVPEGGRARGNGGQGSEEGPSGQRDERVETAAGGVVVVFQQVLEVVCRGVEFRGFVVGFADCGGGG